ncbi:hypothetical protein J437_LFUL016725 [Ladona fulva]|uniref:BACK domain-containing protein n=1 Tax=Ladona fulva TaxID=123851 RepID=A0A8K0P995_LADFU|nr:hypothetical protein J437_LFUL016725 [Ladona fulva]
MFSLGLKESREERIEIKCMDGIILRKIVEYIYSGEIEIPEEHILSILEASSLLQLGSLRSLCLQKLLSTIGPYSTLENYGRLANRLGLHDIESLSYRYTIENLKEVAFGPKKLLWLEAPYEIIRPMLDNPSIHSQPANIILKAIIQWIFHDPENRECYIDELLCWIHQLDGCTLDNETKELLHSNSALLHRLSSLLKLDIDDSRTISPMKEAQVVLAVGGFSEQIALKNVECYLTDSSASAPWTLYLPEFSSDGSGPKDWVLHHVIPAMRYARAYSASAFTDYELFIVGGERHDMPTSNEATMECYNISENTWTLKPGIPLGNLFSKSHEIDPENPFYLRMTGSGAAFVEGNLYVCGGRIESVRQYEKEVLNVPSKWTPASGLSKATWVFNKERNKWRRCADMIQPRAYHGVAAVGGVLYAIGGIGSSDDDPFSICLNTVERFDPWEEKWRNVKVMPSPRAYFGCVTMSHYIYVMGGHNLENCKDTVYKYDSISDTWHFIEYPLPSPFDSLAAGALKYPVGSGKNAPSNSYLIGGRNSYNGLRHVNVYNFFTNRWHCLQSLIQERVGAAIAVLRLPPYGDLSWK